MVGCGSTYIVGNGQEVKFTCQCVRLFRSLLIAVALVAGGVTSGEVRLGNNGQEKTRLKCIV